ncbi:MAG: L-histidine N(alpha)-methyltransferase [Sphingomonas fennica]
MLLDLDRAAATGAPAADPAFRRDVLAGLTAPRKAIPARWLYDHAGSELFEAITDLPEYYPTRTEIGILKAHCAEVGAIVGEGRAVVEFGSGSSAKTPLLLGCIAPAAYVPIDISGDFLRESAARLGADVPGLAIHPVETDFMGPVALPAAVTGMGKLGFFPGSTIGNMGPSAAIDLLRSMVLTLGEGAWLLIGMDRVKDPAILVPAYDDAQGVTGAFNVNLLHRINRELAGTLPVEDFRHRAIWNDGLARIEMHLEATRAIEASVAGRPVSFAAGETIHTENSHKYDPRGSRLLLAAGGWTAVREWTDDEGLFSLILAQARAEPAAP